MSVAAKYLNSFCCGPSNHDDTVFHLVMLGPGEAGKSTVTKQMKIINKKGFTEEEKLEGRQNIRKNVQDAIMTILGAMRRLHITLENPSHEELVEAILNSPPFSAEEENLSEEFYMSTEMLWNDGGVQECYRRSNEYQLIECAKYFLDKLKIVKQTDYIPSDQDILRSRVLSVGIKEMDFYVDDGGRPIHFRMYDVGGQRDERRRWVQVFRRAMAAIFVIDISCFDLTLREDPTKNRLLEAMETLEQAWKNRFLQEVDFIIFLNKIDVLEQKIQEGKSLQTMIDAVDPSHKYYPHLKGFERLNVLSDTEIEAFVTSFPPPVNTLQGFNNDNEAEDQPQLSSWFCFNCFKSKSSSSDQTWRQHDHISDETIRTAVFLKRFLLFIKDLPSKTSKSSSPEPCDDRMCLPFFTCAVDTQTVKKVFESCKSFLIIKRMDEYFGRKKRRDQRDDDDDLD